jgi:biopolymer transport protein ExbB
MTKSIFVVLLLLLGTSAQAKDWWDKEWTVRKQFTIDTTDKGAPIADPIGAAVLLVRLHDGNFKFDAAKEDGSDIRFVADDGKTLLSYHMEGYDYQLHEGFAWVKLPEVKPSATTSFWLYYGNTGPKAVSLSDAKATYDANTALIYHFSDRNAPPSDATKNANTAQPPAPVPLEGALISGGLRLGGTPITVSPSDSLAWKQGAGATISAWVKLAVLQPNAILLSRREETRAFVIGVEAGMPFVEITDEAGARRTEKGSPVAAGAWHHLAIVADVSKVTLLLDGAPYGSITGSLPALGGPLLIGGDSVEGAVRVQGELDELQISNVTRPLGSIKLAVLSQGGNPAVKLTGFAEDEGGGSGGGGESGHFMVIINSLTVDGWIVIVVLGFMAVISWYVMVSKIAYLNSMAKGNAMFMQQWLHLSTDLTALDHGDSESVKSLGGRLDDKTQRHLRASSVYRIYHIGSQEIQHRLSADHNTGALSSRSIQAIRAALDGGLIREKQRIDKLIVLLTICISGGPFLGLLGTVVGVMITFAAVAAAGDVNVNAIAPGIAAALLATVAGLAVAIPALFGYNYILSRVKDATADMHVFIDEFVTKMAEFYSGTNDEGAKPHPNSAPVTMSMLLELLQNLRAQRAGPEPLLTH